MDALGKLLGQRLSARDFDRQVAEIQIRAAILNGFTALGIPKTEAVGQIRLVSGEGRPQPHLCMYGCPRWCKRFLNGLSV